MNAVEPRPYQQEGRKAVDAATHDGMRRPLVSWATGLGKTVLFVQWLTDAIEDDSRNLVLAHRDELLAQTAEKVRLIAPECRMGIVKAERNELDAPLVLASVQTISRMDRLRQLMRGKPFRRIVVDEAHHSEAESYQRVLAALGAFSTNGDGPVTLGVTATPYRGDNKPLGATWEGVVHNVTILDGIMQGYLCDLRGLVVRVDADFNKLRSRRGEILADEAEEMLMGANAPDAIAHAIERFCKTRPTLVFTPGVASSKAVVEECKKLRIAAEHVDGTTPNEERRQVLRRFHDGETTVLSNCAVLTEGYDEERIGCVVMARPTQSQTFYVQCIGRGTRVHPKKEDCLVIDVVGVTHRMDLVNFASLFGGQISDAAQASLADGTSVLTALQEDEERPESERLRYQHVDLFNTRPFVWIKSNLGYVLSLGSKEAGYVILTEEPDASWKAWREAGRNSELLWQGPSLGYAQGIAEDYIRKHGAAVLSQRAARWRKAPATDGQKRMLVLWKVPYHGEAITKGEASDLITQAIANARARLRRR